MNIKIKRYLLTVSLMISGVALAPLVGNNFQHYPFIQMVQAATTDVTDSTKLSEVMPNEKLRNLVWYNVNWQYDQENKPEVADTDALTVGDLGQLKKLQWWPEAYYPDPDYMACEPLNGGNGALGAANPGGSYSLEGLQYAKNLTTLDIAQNYNYGKKYRNNDVTDVSPLANLTKLTDIDLHGNRITDITPISKLPNVTRLNISYNHISDLSSLNTSQYTGSFTYDYQVIVLPKVNLAGNSYTWKNPFIGKLPQGVDYDQTKISMYPSEFTPSLDLDGTSFQAFFYNGDVPLYSSENFVFNNLTKQVIPGPTTATIDGQVQRLVQNPYKYYMNLNYKVAKQMTFVFFLPYQDNVQTIAYKIIPYDRATGKPIPNYTPEEKSGMPGDKVDVPTISGYTPETNQVTIPDAGGDIIAYYNKSPVSESKITVHYEDEAGHSIQDATTTSGKIGDPYNASHPATITKDGTVYEYVGVKDNRVLPTNYAEADQTITYLYKKSSSGGTGGGGTPTQPSTPTTPATPIIPATPITPSTPVTPSNPDEPGGGLIAAKNAAVYSVKPIYLYQGKNFNKSQRIAFYTKKPRINRPMFVVTGYARSNTGKLRYQVRDVNHRAKTAGKRGYITASTKYVLPVYYQSNHKTLTVINPRGVNEYRQKNLTGKVKNYRQGTVLKVKGFVRHNLTTRYQLGSVKNLV